MPTPNDSSKRRLTASELSKLAYCELTIVKREQPTPEQKIKMRDGIRAHSEFEKKAAHFKYEPIKHEHRHQVFDSNSKRATIQGRKIKVLYITVILIMLAAILYLVIN